jgi:hypothetical protein
MTSAFAGSAISFLDMAAAQQQFGANMLAALKPVFADLGLRSTASWWRTSRCPMNCRSCSTSASG